MTDDDLLEELILRYEATQDMGIQVTLAELCKDYPHLEPKLRREIELLEQLDLEVSKVDKTPARSAPAARSRPKSVGRYVPQRTIGQGALGEVLLANDTELQRQVALKRLLAAGHGAGDGRLRFLVEAQVTGRLDHPGVVPVHGLVYDDEQNPYYAMRLIRGESLDAAIARFHREHPIGATSAHLNTDLQSLLRSFLAVCQTVAYAHSQGFLHRDLKPENVMVGRYGETLVVDWGLAKRFAGGEGNPLEATAAAAPDHETALDRQLETLEKTMQGHRKGSPAYMSPEQAAGRWSEVGPASDVYSLGATLYKLLTGQLPFKDPKRVFEQIAAGEYPRPREQRADIPFGLEAICLKAMALKPEDRYDSALALAADIERWLADEPVLALPEPWHLQAQRWIKRHQSWILTGTVGSIIAIVALVVLAVQQNEANAEIAGQKQKAENNLTAAEKNLRLAQKNLYLARMNLASRAVADDWTARAIELLDAERPQPGDREDRRQLEWFYLWSKLQRPAESVALGAKGQPSFDPDSQLLGLSADGRRVAIASKEQLQIREFGMNEPRIVLPIKIGSSDKVAVSPDFRWGVVENDKKLDLWLLAGMTPKEPAFSIDLPEEERIAAIEFSSDSSRMALLTHEGTLELWDVSAKKRLQSFVDLKTNEAKPAVKLDAYNLYHEVAFSHDGAFLAGIRTNDNGVSLAATWSLSDGKRKQFETSTATLNGVMWVGATPIVVALDQGKLEFTELGGKGKPWFRCPDSEMGISVIGTTLSEDATLVLLPWIGLRIVELRAGEQVRSQVFPGKGIMYGLPSSDGSRVLIAEVEGAATLWNAEDLWEPAVLDGPLTSVDTIAWSADSQHWYAVGGKRPKPGAAAKTDASQVVAFNRRGRATMQTDVERVPYLLESSRPQTMLIGEGRGAVLSGPTIALFDAATGNPLPAPTYDTKPETDLLIFQSAPAIRPLVLARGEKGSEVVVAETLPGQKGVRLRRWDAAAAEWRGAEVSLPIEGLIESVAISPDGKWGIVGTSDKDGELSVWPLAAGREPIASLKLNARVSSIVFSPDGAYFAAASQDGQLLVWETKTWKLERTFGSASVNVQTMAFWPGSRRLLVGDITGQITLWDMDETIERYSWHTGFALTALAIAPDGSQFVAGGQRGELRVFHFPKAGDVLPVSIRTAAAQPENATAQRELACDAWGAYLAAKARGDSPGMKESLSAGRGALATLSRIRKLTEEELAWEEALEGK